MRKIPDDGQAVRSSGRFLVDALKALELGGQRDMLFSRRSFELGVQNYYYAIHNNSLFFLRFMHICIIIIIS